MEYIKSASANRRIGLVLIIISAASFYTYIGSCSATRYK